MFQRRLRFRFFLGVIFARKSVADRGASLVEEKVLGERGNYGIEGVEGVGDIGLGLGVLRLRLRESGLVGIGRYLVIAKRSTRSVLLSILLR